jgi:hypothetical protein
MLGRPAQLVLRDLNQFITVYLRDIEILSERLPAVAVETAEGKQRRGCYPLKYDRLLYGIHQLQRHLTEAEIFYEEIEAAFDELRVQSALGITLRRNDADIHQAILEWWTAAGTRARTVPVSEHCWLYAL